MDFFYSVVGFHATLSMGGKLEDIRVFPDQVADLFSKPKVVALDN